LSRRDSARRSLSDFGSMRTRWLQSAGPNLVHLLHPSSRCHPNSSKPCGTMQEEGHIRWLDEGHIRWLDSIWKSPRWVAVPRGRPRGEAERPGERSSCSSPSSRTPKGGDLRSSALTSRSCAKRSGWPDGRPAPRAAPGLAGRARDSRTTSSSSSTRRCSGRVGPRAFLEAIEQRAAEASPELEGRLPSSTPRAGQA